MKRIFVLAVVAGGIAGIAMNMSPGEWQKFSPTVYHGAAKVWESVEANPVPVAIALGTFLLTVVYYKVKGKSLRESVEVAATRVMVVSVPSPSGPGEAAVLARAKARAMRTQLVADQIALENRHRKLPEAVLKAEQDVCYTEQAVADAERSLAEREKAHEDMVARLETLRREKAAGEAELTEIEGELKKLAGII
jgi:hypothetical protein